MKKTTRRLMATCMVLGMAAMALGGCSSSKKKVIGVSLPTQDLAGVSDKIPDRNGV